MKKNVIRTVQFWEKTLPLERHILKDEFLSLFLNYLLSHDLIKLICFLGARSFRQAAVSQNIKTDI